MMRILLLVLLLGCAQFAQGARRGVAETERLRIAAENADKRSGPAGSRAAALNRARQRGLQENAPDPGACPS